MAKFRQAITFGRFNLLHKGHLDLFRQMSEGCEDSLIGVSSASKNLPASQRVEVILKALDSDPEIESFKFQVTAANSPFDLFRQSTFDGEDIVAYFGQDQFELGKILSREFGCAASVIPRLTSSTVVRSLIDNEEWGLLSSVVPTPIINQVISLRRQECPSSR